MTSHSKYRKKQSNNLDLKHETPNCNTIHRHISTTTLSEKSCYHKILLKTISIFNHSDQLSFVSLLKDNEWELNEFGVKGISPTEIAKIPEQLNHSIDTIIGAPGTAPLIDNNPNSPNYGQELVVHLPDGSIGFVYKAPDTFYVDLLNLSSIAFFWNDNNVPSLYNIDSIQFYKKI